MAAVANEQLETDRKVVNVIHFSDVDDINGASRFVSALNVFREASLSPLVFFSGNFISQSDISCVTRGEHMIDIMNRVGITCATLGNHDFDFGERNTYNIIQRLSFPVIHTNLFFDALPLDASTNKPVIGKHLTIVHDDTLLKIGVIGISQNWLHLVEHNLDNASQIHWMDMVEVAQTYIDKLRGEYAVDMIIALTHSKLLNDRVLADKITGIDLILSGHDHLQTCSMTNHTRTLIVKSGSNFNQFSWIQLMVKNQLQTADDDVPLQAYLAQEEGLFKARKYWYKVRYYEVNETLDVDCWMQQMVTAIGKDYAENQLDQTIGEIACNLDCTQFSLLNGECNSANFVSDIIRASCRSDCVILSATTFLPKEEEEEEKCDVFGGGLKEASIGAFNVDGSVNRGGLTYRDIVEKVLCDSGAIIVLKLTGAQIRRAIEHGLSKDKNEMIDGVSKWPHVSGLRFVYDPMAANGAKIKTIWILKHKYVELVDANVYSVATSNDLCWGADGYDIFLDPVSIERDEKESVSGQMMLIQFIRQLNYLNKLKLLTASNHKKGNKKEIERKIEQVGFKSAALAACVETKWVSSFQVLTRENTKQDLAEDDVELGDQMMKRSNELDISSSNSAAGNVVELGVEEEEEEDDEKQIETQQIERKKSLKEKIRHIDKEGMKQKLEDMKRSSKIRLEIMGRTLKKMAIESQNEMEKLSEKAKQLMNKEREIRYDENGNILDVQMFILKPKIDHRVMTVDDEKRWLKLRGDTQLTPCVIDNHSINANDNQKRKKTSDEIAAAAAAANNNDNHKTQRRASLAKLLFVAKSKSISSELLKLKSKTMSFNKKKANDTNDKTKQSDDDDK
eukprot:591169_1